MFVTGPDVIETVTHENVSMEELGGAMTHNATAASPTLQSPTTVNASRCCASCWVSAQQQRG